MKKFIILFCISALFFSCSDSIDTDYQDYLSKGYSEVLFILNGEAESFSAYAPSSESVYQNLQLVGHNGSSEAWPNDLLSMGDSLYTVCSGQNTIEKYDAKTLDYQDKVYLKNGFNPMVLCPVGSGSMAAVAGFETDEIILVDLAEMEGTSGFIKAYEEVNISNPANSETQTTATQKNATGDDQDRRTTGLAASGTTLYASNVRYDTTILLTDDSGDLIEYDGSWARAAGYFREGTISVFELSNDYKSAALIREIDLEDLFETTGGEAYYPGNGLNPQSLFVLNGKLHIICTGTNGGSARTYTSSEYIPEGSTTSTTVPGTDPDDGVVLILDMDDPENPGNNSANIIEIGGSPVGFRYSADEDRNIFYMAGVGGVQSYNYVTENELHDSDDLILAGSDPSSDFYSHILYQDDKLYISDYSHDKLNRISISDNGSTAEYDLLDSISTGDGPGAMAYIKY